MSFTVVNLIKGHTAPFKSLDLRKRSEHIGRRCVATLFYKKNCYGISLNCFVPAVQGLKDRNGYSHHALQGVF